MKVLIVIALFGAVCGLVAGIGGLTVGDAATATFGFLAFVVCSGLVLFIRSRVKRNPNL